LPRFRRRSQTLTHSAEARVRSFPHWYHQIEVFPGVVTPGVNASGEALRSFPLPADCRTLRVLDVGTRDGFFAFELERRGANVVAIDHAPPGVTGFEIAKDLLGSKVPYVVANVYDVTPATHGTFDLVLFLGVLYHLRDPLLALDRLAAVCAIGGRMFVESQVIDEAFLDPGSGALVPMEQIAPKLREAPIMQFYPRDALNRDFTNWWAPNMACLRAMFEMTGFVVEYTHQAGSRGVVVGRRVEDQTIDYYRSIEKGVIGPRPR
jgi:tRNA (mo5U34)-methyltransferase